MDKNGIPYVFHPFHLAEQMTDEISKICALLQDVVDEKRFDGIKSMPLRWKY